MSSLKDKLRLRRSRAVGLTLIFIIMFMIGGFFFGSPFVNSLDNLAPQQQIPIPVGGDTAGTDPSVNIPVDQTQPDQSANENPNEQITSNADLCTQIGDESGSPLYCSSNPLVIESTVLKIDSNGNEVVSISRSIVPALSFVEDISNIDFSTGRLEISTILENPELASIIGSADFDILIDNQTIFTSPISVEWSPTATSFSTVNGEFVTSTGRSSEFIFLFADHLDKFPTIGVTPLEIKLNNVDITVESRDKFGADSLLIFRMNIATDPDTVVIVDEEQGNQLIFATDDQLFLQSKQVVKLTSNSTNLNRGFPCPEMGSINVLDFDNKPLFFAQQTPVCVEQSVDSGGTPTAPIYLTGSVPLLDELIQRNSTYNIIISSPTPANFLVQTPNSQKNYSFYCILEEESKIPLLTAPLDNVYGQSFGTSTLTTENLFIVCNFPISGIVS